MGDIKKWFFTFGTYLGFPFQRGWVEIEAPTREQAVQVFRAYWPDRTPGTVNCAFIYSEDEFKETRMYKGEYPEEHCHAKVFYE